MAHLHEVEVDRRPLNAYIRFHPPREQRPPLLTGAELGNVYDRRVRVSVLHNQGPKYAGAACIQTRHESSPDSLNLRADGIWISRPGVSSGS
jgi:hypothetical protein